jgi:ssDNA-binding Zn-finger/Zn-ribbon topoisomerase 1
MDKPRFADGLSGTILCPKCMPRVALVVRTNRLTKVQFLGCPNWPDCGESAPIPESWRMRAMGQQELDLFKEGA